MRWPPIAEVLSTGVPCVPCCSAACDATVCGHEGHLLLTPASDVRLFCSDACLAAWALATASTASSYRRSAAAWLRRYGERHGRAPRRAPVPSSSGAGPSRTHRRWS